MMVLLNIALHYIFATLSKAEKMSYRSINRFRKVHRFLGIFIGIQFLFWTVSGLYFSWTNIDEIHGDHYRKETSPNPVLPPYITAAVLQKLSFPLHSIESRALGAETFLWVNDSILFGSYSWKHSF